MAKLYPPYIEGTIPAFYTERETGIDGTDYSVTKLTVPFSMNKAVGFNEIKGFSLKMKTVQTNTFIGTVDCMKVRSDNSVTFELGNDIVSKLNIGQSYKIQLAYWDSEQIGFYSTVGVTKYTSEPIVYIEDLDIDDVNSHKQGGYLGVFKNTEDPTEKVYSYKFVIKDSWGNIFDESGNCLHNSTNNEINSSTDSWVSFKELRQDVTYYIKYTVTTNNGLVYSSYNYRLMDRSTLDPEADLVFMATPNEENGYVSLQLIGGLDAGGAEKPATGAFVIKRKDIQFSDKWDLITNFVLQAELPSSVTFRDFTIEQGKTYIYAIQQYNDFGLYSNKIYSNPVRIDFEDAFLYDGDRQLKIKYNPKVTSFKNDILETKVDTLGNKYPFIFRNGNVNYKEFPISGLISYWSDDEELFIPLEDLGLDDIDNLARFTSISSYEVEADGITYMLDRNYDIEEVDAIYQTLKVLEPMVNDGIANDSQRKLYEYLQQEVNAINNSHIHSNAREVNNYENITYIRAFRRYRKKIVEELLTKHPKQTNLDDYNMAAERVFKLEVLEWLTNGKPKLFKSPSEGNYIVRLMGTSLTPNDTVGRMLHTFQCTAYEIAPYNYETLGQYGFTKIQTPTAERLRWKTIELYNPNLYSYVTTYTKPVIANPSNNYATEEQWQVIDLLNPQVRSDKSLKGEYDTSLTGYMAQSIRFEGMRPGDQVMIRPKDGELMTVTIGATGAYLIDGLQPIEDVFIRVNTDTYGNTIMYEGMFTFSYYGIYQNVFNLIEDINVKDVPARQFIGENIHNGYNQNIITTLNNCKHSVIKYFAMVVEKRPVEYLYFRPNDTITVITSPVTNMDAKYFYPDRDAFGEPLSSWDGLNEFALYKIFTIPTEIPDDEFHFGWKYYRDAEFDKYYEWEGSYIDGHSKAIIPEEEYNTKFYYNLGIENDSVDFNLKNYDNNIKYAAIDLNDKIVYEWEGPIDVIDDLYLSCGVMMTIGYQDRITTYSLESNNAEVAAAKEIAQALDPKAFKERYSGVEWDDEIIRQWDYLLAHYDEAYDNFIRVLDNALVEYKEDKGINNE